MNKNKLVSAILAAVFLLGLLSAPVLAATPTITVSTVSGAPGKEVSVTVSVAGNPGVCAGRLAVSHGEYLELTGVTDGGLLSGANFGTDKTADPYYVTWDDSLAAKDNAKNGTLVTLKFRIKSDAPSGSQPVTVSYVPGDFVNVSLKSVTFAVTNGAVKVRSGALARFDDVDPDAYYADPVSWAVEKNITTGTGANTFSPDDGCTRGQVVTFLYRSKGEPEPSAASNPFGDVGASDYFYKAVLWAVGEGITKGTSSTEFSPYDVCTRGQVVTFLWRSSGSPEPETTAHGFLDVKNSDYFFKPVLWAVENGVTKGTSSTTFSPDEKCTRAQVVTFLKRADDAAPAKEETPGGDTADGKTESGVAVLASSAARSPLGTTGKTSGAQGAKETLIAGMREFAERIDISAYGLDEDRLEWIFQEIINTVPDLFYVHILYQYTYDPSTGRIYDFIPTYTVTDKEQIARMKTEYESLIEEVCSLVDPSWSDVEKALFVHDYVLTGFEYDTSYEVRDAYNFFLERRGVCQAYTLFYIEVLKRFGINVDAVISTSMNHTWNRVQIGGKWYHVDLAWDDPVPDQLGAAIHRYFLVSDEYISSGADGRDPHYGWKGYGDDVACSDRSFEGAAWKDVATPFVPLNGWWYFIGKSSSGYALMKTADLKNATVVKDLPEMWGAGEHGAYWVGYFSGLCNVDGLLVYNTPREILSFDPATGAVNCLYRLPDGGNDLYGVVMRETIYYAVQKVPTEAAEYVASIPSATRYDADADGYIAMKDLVYLRKFLSGAALILNRTGADADLNGAVNSADVPVLRAYLAGN